MQVHATPNYSATIFHTELQVIYAKNLKYCNFLFDDEARRTACSMQLLASFALIAASKLRGSIKIEITLNRYILFRVPSSLQSNTKMTKR